LPVTARIDDQFDGLRADTFERGECVIDRAIRDLEDGAGAIDVGRLDLDPEPLRLGAKLRELFGVV
jgi:hypothetical protein